MNTTPLVCKHCGRDYEQPTVYLEWAKKQYPGARFEATNGNSIHGTFPGWGGAPDVSNSRKRYK